MIARAARYAARLACLAAVAIGCRDIYVCHDSALCTAVNAGAGAAELGGNDSEMSPATSAGSSAANGTARGTSGAAGGGNDLAEAGAAETPSAAGAPGSESCELPLANCDRSGLNGCETNVSVAVDHCGACNERCAGVCAQSSCHLLDELTKQPIRPLSPFAVTTEYLYFMWGDEGGPYRLSRVDKMGGTPELVADNLPELTGIAAAPGRIFLWGDGENLHSVTPAGMVTDEGFAVSAVASQADVVYAVRDDALIERKSDSSNWQAAAHFSAAEHGVELWPVDVDGQLVVLRSSGIDETAHYDVMLVDQLGAPDAEPALLASGSGALVQVRASRTHVYWLTSTSSALGAAWFELRRHDVNPDSAEELVARELDVLGFAVDDAYAYLPRSVSTGNELELVMLGDRSEKLHLGARRELTFPESVANFLWFFDLTRQRLMRVDLGFGEPP